MEQGVPNYISGCKESGTEMVMLKLKFFSYTHFLPRKIMCDLCKEFGKQKEKNNIWSYYKEITTVNSWHILKTNFYMDELKLCKQFCCYILEFFKVFLHIYIIILYRNIQFIIPPLSVSLLKTTLWCQPLCVNIGLHSLLFPREGLLKENCRLKAMNTFKTLDIFSSALFFSDLKARAQAFRESDKLQIWESSLKILPCFCVCVEMYTSVCTHM